MDLNDAIATLQRVQAEKERKKEYMKNYLHNYSKERRTNDPVFRDKNRANAMRISYEEYIARKEAGLIKVGRPRKTVTA